MYGTVNMLTAKKVKLHGMQSHKWTTQDKITQYKGLINLYTRDRKIMEVDTNVTRRKLQRELVAMRNQVDKDRHLLDNAIRGDKQQLRNTLMDHRELQLAYCNSQPHKIMECVHQLNFTKRKALDRLTYLNNLKAKELIALKQEKSLLEDRLKYAFLGQIKQEKDAQIITGKVQDATLKREAALAIKQIYIDIIDIMKKDTLYYDAILNTIESDGYNQSKCFLGATTLGQLATEYLDDRRQDYVVLEKVVLQDMGARKRDIKMLEENLKSALGGIKDLLRRDSDINLCSVELSETPSMEDLRKDITNIETTLQFLKNTTAVHSYESIYPCLNQQVQQDKRLKHLRKKCERNKDILLNKLNHAELMSNVLENTMVETTSEYKKRRLEINKEMQKLDKKKHNNYNKVQYQHDVFANIAIGLRQLLQLSKFINTEHELKNKMPKISDLSHAVDTCDSKVKEPEKDLFEALEILPVLVTKFTYLMTNYRDKKEDFKVDEVYRTFEYMIRESMGEMGESAKKMIETSLLEGVFTEATHQLAREDIKKQSKQIVEENTKNDDLVPLFVPLKKTKFGKLKK